MIPNIHILSSKVSGLTNGSSKTWWFSVNKLMGRKQSNNALVNLANQHMSCTSERCHCVGLSTVCANGTISTQGGMITLSTVSHRTGMPQTTRPFSNKDSTNWNRSKSCWSGNGLSMLRLWGTPRQGGVSGAG